MFVIFIQITKTNMSNLQSIVTENYDVAVRDLGAFRFDHAEVIEEFEHLQKAVEEAKNALIDYAKQNKISMKTEYDQFNFVQPYKKHYDVKIALDLAKELGCSQAVNECIEIETSIDMEKFDKLVDAGQIPLDIRVKAYKEEPMSARVCKAINKE